MGLFGKKQKEEIPSLPELPKTNVDLALPSTNDLPEIQSNIQEIETKELPELPEIKTNEISQESIKDAVSMQGMQKSKFNIEPPSKTEHFKPLRQNLPRTIEIESAKPTFLEKPLTQKAEPIYIRLDKFETTVEAFEEIKNKIQEIEKLLQKTKEIKQKEEQELIEWEREIQMIKTRIDSIDKNIFNRLD